MRGQFWIKDDKKKMNEKEKKIKKFIKIKPMETIGDGVCGFLNVPNGCRKDKKDQRGRCLSQKLPSQWQ